MEPGAQQFAKTLTALKVLILEETSDFGWETLFESASNK